MRECRQRGSDQNLESEMTEIFGEQIAELIEKDLLQWKNGDGSTLVLTKRGILLGNQVFMEFVGND